MRPSRLFSSCLVLASSLVVSSVFAAPTDPPAPPDALNPTGRQPDPTEVAAPTPPPATTQTPKPPVLEVPALPPPPPPPPPPLPYEDPEPEGYAQGDHFEFTMGFLAGQRSYTKTSFSYKPEDSTAEGIGGGGLVAPFVRPPFDKTTVLGLRYDVRLVMSFIRMTVGFDLPFTTYKVSDSAAPENVNGTMRQVTVQSLSSKELRFGIGAEYPWKKVAIFADVIGGVHWVDTELSIDGYKANYGATSFAFSGRAGVRAYVRKWFFATASGEVGFIGDLNWNAEFAVGFSAK